jgi:hypothetical protein
MADTDKLRAYTRADQPTISGNERQFLDGELKKIATSLSLILTVLKEHEARLTAGSL